MKKFLLAWLMGVSLLAVTLGLLALPVTAAELDALKISDVEWRPRTAFPGDEIHFRVTYENSSDTAVTDDRIVRLQVVVQTRDNAGQEVTALDKPVGSLDGLAPGESGVITATLIAPSAGDYNAIARLLVNDQLLDEHSEPFPVENPLPPGIAQLFAGLGMFIAVITMMALGTEVVIDSLKFFIGLKRKVTAIEAFDKLERELPGELAALGVVKTATDEFKRLAQELRATLRPVENATQMYDHIQAGAFGPAYQALAAMAPSAGHVTEAQLAQLKDQARAGVSQGILVLQTQLDLSPEQTQGLEAYLLARINAVTVDTAASLLEEVFKAIQAWSPQVTQRWLTDQLDTLLAGGRTQATALIDDNLLPLLEGLGFDRDPARVRLVALLDEMEATGRQSALAYIASVQNLLKAVEERRNEMQSPLRKIYRRLRQSKFPFWAVVGAVVAAVLAWWAAAYLLWPAAASTTIVKFLATTGIALLIGVIVAWLMNRPGFSKPELGSTLLRIEESYNRLLGRDQQPKDDYGQVDKDITGRIESMGLTTVAQVLMEREDKHRDEEASRLRVLRVISLIVGVILAYLLQIDAALLLNEAVPGVARSINAILNLSPQQLNAFWPALPDNNWLTAGILLTGLAASAGSAFWHEQLGRLQGAKDKTEAAAKLLRRTRDLPEEG